MSDQEKELLEIVKELKYGEIVIKKEGGKIVHVKRTESIKLSEEPKQKFF
jgi:hypothetical protein